MSNAWETTLDDVENVLTQKFGGGFMESTGQIHEDLDHSKIEDAALHGNDMDEQTGYAHEEIEKQIREMIGDGRL